MKHRGKLIPVLVEVIPDVFVEQGQVPGIRRRFPRPWRPKLRSKKRRVMEL